MIKTMTVSELQKRVQESTKPFLLDVREPHELDICKLAFDEHIPLGDLPDDYEKLPKDAEIVVYCRSGARSLRACEFLEDHGYGNLTNLSGGVLAWANDIDPTMQKY
ncbi:MAG: rhodanese-like domain-containing protein [Bdellovibrionales bacterium]|nr:rhodanese-like domain-containing protein [Bdellovibrionales bacterium]